MEQWTILSINNSECTLTLSNGSERKKIKVEKNIIKKLMVWDRINISDTGIISVAYRSKPLSVSKCIKLMKNIDSKNSIPIKIHGKLSEDGTSISDEKSFIELAIPLSMSFLRGSEIIMENAILKNGKISFSTNSRILSNSKNKQ